MLRASALIYSIVLSIVILLITLFLISTIYYSDINFIRLKRIERANDNFQSILLLLLNNPAIVSEISAEGIDIYKDGKDIAYFKLSKWGIQDICNIVCPVGKDTLNKYFILGYEHDKGYAINITATDRTLNIAGNTEIMGDAYIPGGTFKRVYIENRGSSLQQPISGKINPSLYKARIDYSGLQKQIENFVVSVTDASGNIFDQPTQISFAEEAKIYWSASDIHLSSLQLKGHCIIKSATKITADESAKLDDLILIAPEINIDDAFTGSLQCFASNIITIGQHVHLKYPSVLCLSPSQKIDTVCSINIGEHTIIAGQIISFNKSHSNLQSEVILKNNAKFYGQIFSAGRTQISGMVSGNIQTGSFVAKTAASFYENTLLDANINILNLDENYMNLIKSTDGKKRVAKWLY